MNSSVPPTKWLQKIFPELLEVQSLAAHLPKQASCEVLAKVPCPGADPFPLYGFVLGSTDPSAPTLFLNGGVHGLERIGAQVVTAALKSFWHRLGWDDSLHRDLEKVRIVAIPLLNPAGMWRETRCNAQGVDLMRNAPIDAEAPLTPLLSGHRISPRLPWYRGPVGAPMEPELQALIRFWKSHCEKSRFVVSLDVHSGFGSVDSLWFPWAKSMAPFPDLANVMALKKLFDDTYPHHVYRIEPQALSYVTHGDVWDFLYMEQKRANPGQLYLPLTLEIGSWIWIKKNPLQLFSFLGPFNPVKPHRKRRILRRHLHFIDFLQRAALSHERWRPQGDITKNRLEHEAMTLWYQRRPSLLQKP